MPHKFGHPFIYQGDYSIPDDFWHFGELERIQDLLIEMNKTRSQLINDRKGNKRKYLAKANHLDNDTSDTGLRSVLETDDDNQIASITLAAGEALDSIVARCWGSSSNGAPSAVV